MKLRNPLVATAIVAATFAVGGSTLEARAEPTPDCFVHYYVQDGGTYDHVKAGCKNLQPDYMVRVQAYMELRHDGVFGNVWVSGPWVDCSWNPNFPNQNLSVLQWQADNQGERIWTADSYARYQVRSDNDGGC
jgi:hypothetical protein